MPYLQHLPVAQDLGRRLQHRRGGVLAGDPAARGGPARAHASSTRPTSTPTACAPREAGVYAHRALRAVHRELPARRADRARSPTTTPRPTTSASFDRALQAARSCSPTTASRPTACSPRCSWSRAATCSSTSSASCRTARSACSAIRCAARLSRARASRRRLRFSTHADRIHRVRAATTRIYQQALRMIATQRRSRSSSEAPRARSRRCSTILPRRCRAAFAGADRGRAPPACRTGRACLAADLRARLRAPGEGGRGQGAARRPARLRRAAGLPPARSRQQRCFSLSVDEPVHFSRPSIDVLFESAADAYGPALVGVLLSGANDDGARGLARIAPRAGSRSCRPGCGDVPDHAGGRARRASAPTACSRRPRSAASCALDCAAVRRRGARMNTEPSSSCWSTTSRRTSSRSKRCCAATASSCSRRARVREALELLLVHDVRARAARRADARDGRLRARRADARRRAHEARADHLRDRRQPRPAARVQGLRDRRGRLPVQADRPARAARARSTCSSSSTASAPSCAQALRLNEMFVGILGHDLRNPLGALLTGTELLRDPAHRRAAAAKTLRRMTLGGPADDRDDRAAPRSHARAHSPAASGLVARASPSICAVSSSERFEEHRGTHPDMDLRVTSSGNTTISGDDGGSCSLSRTWSAMR